MLSKRLVLASVLVFCMVLAPGVLAATGQMLDASKLDGNWHIQAFADRNPAWEMDIRIVMDTPSFGTVYIGQRPAGTIMNFAILVLFDVDQEVYFQGIAIGQVMFGTWVSIQTYDIVMTYGFWIATKTTS